MQSTKEVTKKWFWKIYIYIFCRHSLILHLVWLLSLFFTVWLTVCSVVNFKFALKLLQCVFSSLSSQRIINYSHVDWFHVFLSLSLFFLDKALSQEHIRRRIHTRTFILNQTYTYGTRYTHKHNHSTLKRTHSGTKAHIQAHFHFLLNAISLSIIGDHGTPQMSFLHYLGIAMHRNILEWFSVTLLPACCSHCYCSTWPPFPLVFFIHCLARKLGSLSHRFSSLETLG